MDPKKRKIEVVYDITYNRENYIGGRKRTLDKKMNEHRKRTNQESVDGRRKIRI